MRDPGSVVVGSFRGRSLLAESLGLLAALVVLIVVFSLRTEHFFSPTTFLAIANQIPAALLVAVGMTYVLIVGEIDLSVGSVLGLCSAVLGVAMTQGHWPLSAAVAVTLAVPGANTSAMTRAVKLALAGIARLT